MKNYNNLALFSAFLGPFYSKIAKIKANFEKFSKTQLFYSETRKFFLKLRFFFQNSRQNFIKTQNFLRNSGQFRETQKYEKFDF